MAQWVKDELCHSWGIGLDSICGPGTSMCHGWVWLEKGKKEREKERKEKKERRRKRHV